MIHQTYPEGGGGVMIMWSALNFAIYCYDLLNVVNKEGIVDALVEQPGTQFFSPLDLFKQARNSGTSFRWDTKA